MRFARPATEKQSAVVPRLPWWLVTAYALLNAAGCLSLVFNDDSRPLALRVVTIIAIILASLSWLFESLGYRSHWWSIALEAIAIMLVAVSLSIPDRAKGFLFSMVSRRGLCANSRATVVFGVSASSVTFVIAVIIHSTFLSHRDASSFVESVSSLPGVFVAAATTRMLVEGLAARSIAEEALRRLALHDGLTGLANRTKFLEMTGIALNEGARVGEPTAVLLLDLDAFKTVNDTLGHSAGDKLLVEVAERLRTCLREKDALARLGGDEFAVLVRGGGLPEAKHVADRILAAFERPVRLESSDDATAEVRVRVSLGAVVVEREAVTDASALLRDADMAMYEAKRAGGHRWTVFEPTLREQLNERVAVEDALREAMDSGALYLNYQPCVDLTTNEITSMEALLRWNDPVRGLIPPRQFIPIAEDTGLILHIGRWALMEACRQTSLWQPLVGRPLTVAVNLSARQLGDPRVFDDLRRALAESGLPRPVSSWN